MNKSITPVKIILIGLLAAQIIATLQVYISNLSLYQTLAVIHAHDYYPVPNMLVMPYLRHFLPAFIGGMFFTFTVGAGLTLFTFAVVWSWVYVFRKIRLFGIVLMLLWAICLFCLNKDGFNLLPSLYVLVVPGTVSIAVLKWFKWSTHPLRGRHMFVHILPVAILAVLWTTQVRDTLFLDIRDNLLFSNPIGTAFSNIYYKYTLYPANVFQTLDQKLLKTCNLDGIRDKTREAKVEKILRERDYLCIDKTSSADLTIREKGDEFYFEHRSKPILNVSSKRFFSRPVHVLRDFSNKSDRHNYFRQLTYISLLIGFPLVLYGLLFGFLRFLFAIKMDAPITSVTSSVLCFAIGLTVWAIFYINKHPPVERKDIPAAMASGQWQDRAAAFKAVFWYGRGIDSFGPDEKICQNPHILYRYWLAKALGTSRNIEGQECLMRLLDDPNPIVVCAALEALGKRKAFNTRDTIMNKIDSTDHWYVQWYGYKTLRALGWTQTRSK